MITYEWKFPQFTTETVGDLNNVVTTIFWELFATNGTSGARVYGSVNLPAPNAENFTQLADITKDWAIAAVSSVKDVEAMRAGLALEIEQRTAPPSVNIAPPFGVN